MAMDKSDKHPTRHWRERIRETERDTSRLRLLQGAASNLAQSPDASSALEAAVVQAARFLAMDSAALLRLDSGALTVQAAHGLVLPVGARLMASGALAAALKQPLAIRERAVSAVRIPAGPVALEVLVPLKCQGDVAGLLALLSSKPVIRPDEEDMATLQALATLLGLSLGKRPVARASRASRREASQSIAKLTPREQQVLALLPRGLSNAELAEELGMAMGTAKIHVERILHKLGVRDRTQAAVRATEWGLAR